MAEAARVDGAIMLRVQFSTLEDARRVVFLCLEGVLPAREQSRQAGVIAARLRDAGVLGQSVEQHYSAAQVGALCGGRSSAWAVKHARLGEFGPVACDGGHWLIPASGVLDYLLRYQVAVTKKDAREIGVMGEKKFSKGRYAGTGSVDATSALLCWESNGYDESCAGCGNQDLARVDREGGGCAAGRPLPRPMSVTERGVQAKAFKRDTYG